jgi:hypothetical protein
MVDVLAGVTKRGTRKRSGVVDENVAPPSIYQMGRLSNWVELELQVNLDSGEKLGRVLDP